MLLLKIFVILIYAFFAFNVLYLLVFAIAGKFRRNPDYSAVAKKIRIAILIPAYREDRVIIDTAQRAAIHDYPTDRFDVFVIADKLQSETINTLRSIPKVTVFPVEFKQSTKARSLKHGLSQIPEGAYDAALILDNDNVMDTGCLEKANAAFDAGFRFIQLHRYPKNTNTPTAILDAMSEEINNHIFRHGHRAAGLSSALIGSGMLFDFGEFKKIMDETEFPESWGEDRELNLEVVKRGFTCEYIEDARVFDEKVQSNEVLKTQRTRWFSSHRIYLKRFWVKEFRKTFTNGFNYFNIALQTLILPRVLLVFLLGLLMVVEWILFFSGAPYVLPFSGSWSSLFVLLIIAMAISIAGRIPGTKIFRAALTLPSSVISIIAAVMKSGGSQKEFISTPKEFFNEGQEGKELRENAT